MEASHSFNEWPPARISILTENKTPQPTDYQLSGNLRPGLLVMTVTSPIKQYYSKSLEKNDIAMRLREQVIGRELSDHKFKFCMASLDLTSSSGEFYL